MRVTVEIREEAFRTPKTSQQVAEEMRQAAAVFWVARGDLAPEAVNDLAPQSLPEAEAVNEMPATVAGKQETLMDYLLSMPDVGEDTDFERPVDYGRPLVELE